MLPKGAATLARMPPQTAARTLRVIEPNLTGHSGHYAEFVRGLAARAGGEFGAIEVLASTRAAGALDDLPRIRFRGAFGARGSHGSEAAALREALEAGDPFLVLTAHAVHAPLLAWLARGRRRAGLRNARLYFHWRERGALDRAMVAAAPRVREEAVAIAPTAPTAAFLRAQGWRRVAEVPYPMLAPATLPEAGAFRHLLVAGAARVNKGLALVAELAEVLGREGDSTPLLVQTTPKRRSGRRGTQEETLLARLARSGAPGLAASDEAPGATAYGARFEGALVLAPYDPAHFADNVSGVVLDALLRGAPVIASEGSWPGRMVERFGAGALLRERTGTALARAVRDVLADWEGATARARAAAPVLAAEHDPVHLVRVLRAGV